MVITTNALKSIGVLVLGLCLAVGVGVGWRHVKKSSAKQLGASGPPSPFAPNANSAGLGGNESLTKEKFFFPMLGEVTAFSRTQDFSYIDAKGVKRAFPMKVFLAENGNFLRAEYTRPNSENWELNRQEQLENYEGSGEVVSGFPVEPAHVSVQTVLDSVSRMNGGEYWNATKLNITYVLLSEEVSFSRRPLFVVEVFGTGLLNSRIMPDEMRFKRIRFLVDEVGQVYRIDDVL